MNCKFSIKENSPKAIWEITHKCNYACSYCIFSCNRDNKNTKDELNTNECFHVIDELYKNGFKELKITGGEPFIRKDIIDILKYASKYMITDISTNASLITERLVNELNDINLKMIHVSLDGLKNEHESVRGINTYDRTIKGLSYLKNSKNKVRIGTVIHKNNENDLESIVNLVREFNVNEIIFSIMEPVEGEDKSLYKTKNNKLLIKEILDLKDKYKDIIINLNFLNNKNNINNCPGGNNFIYINNLGNVSPCTWVLENDKDLITRKSLRNNSLTNLLEEKKIKAFINNKTEGKCYGEI